MRPTEMDLVLSIYKFGCCSHEFLTMPSVPWQHRTCFKLKTRKYIYIYKANLCRVWYAMGRASGGREESVGEATILSKISRTCSSSFSHLGSQSNVVITVEEIFDMKPCFFLFFIPTHRLKMAAWKRH
ncbi:hypothetical protein IGI04_012188 [Brassica rapa subsp. trilocularis]|uniref:Uncharacterized protein n=1 Tax=Brassica rapa subsp. trilocularis TaxID=1813537 RepID=A0ABQ7N593_BRACM|nr:hypothetical protein IGI04_012188 [Brassica rapa subsp. trilocularis]